MKTKLTQILMSLLLLTALLFSGCDPGTSDAGENPPITHSLAFEANGSTGSLESQRLEEGQTITLPACEFTLSGWHFTGWSFTANGSVEFTDSAEFTMGDSDVTLFAQWAQNYNTVTFIANGGSGEDYTQRITEGQTAPLSDCSFFRSGHIFTGWASSSDGSVEYANQAPCTPGDSGLTLYACWESWTDLQGDAGAETLGKGIGSDAEGNLYVTGYTEGGSLNGQVLTGSLDLFLSKYSSSGELLWTRQLGVTGDAVHGNSLSVDAQGNSYIGGCTYGALGGQTQTGYPDLLVCKYNSSGEMLWARQLGVSGKTTICNGIETDQAGNVYATGYTSGDLDGQTLNGDSDSFIVKYSSTGEKQWTRLLGVSDSDTGGYGICMDSQGSAYVTGKTNGPLDGQTNSGIRDIFLSKYNSSGERQWTRLLAAPGESSYAKGVSTDSDDNIYVTGYTEGNFDGHTLAGDCDLFIVKYNSTGDKQWSNTLGASSIKTYVDDIDTDTQGNSYITGTTNGNLDGESLTGKYDMLVVKYNSGGEKQWTQLMGASDAYTEGNAIHLDLNGDCHIVGDTAGNFEGIEVTGDYDVLITTISKD